MRTRRPEPHTLAGAYALDALTGSDLLRFERHRGRCEQCAAEVAGMREATARLAIAVATEPPATLIARAVAAAARFRQLPPAVTVSHRFRPAVQGGPHRQVGRRRPVWRPWQAAAVAAAMLVEAAVLGLAAPSAQHDVVQDQVSGRAIAAVLTAPDVTMFTARVRTGGTASIVMSGREHALVFTAAGLRQLPASQCYELWLMRPGQDRPAAMLPEPQQGMTGPVLASGLSPGDRLGLTVEPAGGTERPTSPVILQVVL